MSSTKRKAKAKQHKARQAKPKPLGPKKAKPKEVELKQIELWSPERLGDHTGDPAWKIRRQCEAGEIQTAAKFPGGWVIPVLDGRLGISFDWSRLARSSEAAASTGLKVAWVNRLRQEGRVDARPVIGSDGKPRFWMIVLESLRNPRPTANGREFVPKHGNRAS